MSERDKRWSELLDRLDVQEAQMARVVSALESQVRATVRLAAMVESLQTVKPRARDAGQGQPDEYGAEVMRLIDAARQKFNPANRPTKWSPALRKAIASLRKELDPDLTEWADACAMWSDQQGRKGWSPAWETWDHLLRLSNFTRYNQPQSQKPGERKAAETEARTARSKAALEEFYDRI